MVTKLFHVELSVDMQNAVNQCNRTRKTTFFALTKPKSEFSTTFAAGISRIGLVIQHFKKLLKPISLLETK